MIVRFGLLRRKPTMSPEEFDRHWCNIHGPLAAALPGLKAYYQHRVVEKGAHPIAGNWDLDGISELHFDDEASMNAAFSAPSSEARDDLALFLADVKLVVCEKHAVIPADLSGSSFIKWMSLVRRRPGLSDEELRREWLGVHAKMMHGWPHVLGYNQNLVIDRISAAGNGSASADELPVDGIVEIWFPGHEKAAEAHATEVVAETRAHARAFLSEITPFLVETRRFV